MTVAGCSSEGLCRVFARHEGGSTAVEFALIAPPFLFMLLAVMQMALVLFAGQRLENATATLGRLVRTGQAQQTNLTQAAFRTALCSEMAPFLPCKSDNLYIDVQTLPNFSAVPWNLPVNAGGDFVGPGSFQPGTAGQIVVVRTFYRYPVLIPMVGASLANIGDRVRLLSSAAVFRNEPF